MMSDAHSKVNHQSNLFARSVVQNPRSLFKNCFTDCFNRSLCAFSNPIAPWPKTMRRAISHTPGKSQGQISANLQLRRSFPSTVLARYSLDLSELTRRQGAAVDARQRGEALGSPLRWHRARIHRHETSLCSIRLSTSHVRAKPTSRRQEIH